jgi:hypothetical protein
MKIHAKPKLPAFFIIALTFFTAPVFAGSGTWKQTPASNNWNTGNNWTSGTVPNGASDTATFDMSHTTGISIAAEIEVNGIVFNANAASNPFTITVQPDQTLTISGTGITNNSGVSQSFVTSTTNSTVGSVITFFGSATAGTNTVITNNSASLDFDGAGQTYFNQNSTAGQATIYNNGGSVRGTSGGFTEFVDNATAASATITNYGSSVADTRGGSTFFAGSSTAGTATINNFAGSVSTDTTSINGQGVWRLAFDYAKFVRKRGYRESSPGRD